MTLATTKAAIMQAGFENSIEADGKISAAEFKAELDELAENIYGDMSEGGMTGADIVIEFNGGTNIGGGAHTTYFDDPRVFNSIVEDKFGTVSLSNGGAYIDGVPLGNYYCKQWGKFFATGMSRNSIYNLTSGTPDLCIGDSVDTTNGGKSSGEGVLICPAISTIFQHWFRTDTIAGTSALGKPMSNKPNNIHARIELWKIS